MPNKRFFKKNIPKFIIQRFNSIKTKCTYIKYTKYKVKCVISILLNFIEIIILTNITGLFSKFLKKISI